MLPLVEQKQITFLKDTSSIEILVKFVLLNIYM